MKNLLFYLATILTTIQSIAQEDCTKFPSSNLETDYVLRGFYVHAAFPLNDTMGRMLVKGSQEYSWYKITNHKNEIILPDTRLSSPNFTSLVQIPIGNVYVHFSKDGKVYQPSDTIPSEIVGQRIMDDAESPFSILLYGCFEPFEVNEKTGEAQLNKGKNNSNYFMRTLFNKVALGKPLYHYQQERNNDSSKYEFKNLKDKRYQPVIKNVKAILGTGDQVYVDAGYKNQDKKTDISTWQIKEKPMPLVDTTCYKSHLNSMYLHFSSFDKLQEVFANKPSFSMWDDHEIRDGWGSQGDEYTQGKLTDPLRRYYLQSRRAFIEHQWIKGPVSISNIEDLINDNVSLHQTFSIGGKKGFAFDLRSERDINRRQVISQKQLDDFKNWLVSLDKNEEIILLSSIPLFITYRKIIKYSGTLKAEAKDDIADGWDSNYNVAQRDSIIFYLLKSRIEKNIKPYIVSGDIHSGGITEIWYDDDGSTNLCFSERKKDRKILAYEIISSGLNHETLNQGSFWEGFKSEGKKAIKDLRVSNSMVENIKLNDKKYSIDNFLRVYGSKLNFGSIEFDKDKTKLHTFLFDYTKTDHVEELTVIAEWDKTEIDDRKHYKITNNTCNNFNYLPPLPQERRKIYMKKNW
ncbi:MAG: alkaline phosphatase D family protein [Leadbetterella sp.]